MADVKLTFGKGGAYSAAPETSVYQRDARSESVTSSGTSAPSTLQAGQNEICTVFCATAVHATPSQDGSGAATEATGRHCPGGIATDIKCLKGDYVHVIDA